MREQIVRIEVMEAERDMKRAQRDLTVQQARYEGLKAGAAYATGIIAFIGAVAVAVLSSLSHTVPPHP